MFTPTRFVYCLRALLRQNAWLTFKICPYVKGPFSPSVHTIHGGAHYNRFDVSMIFRVVSFRNVDLPELGAYRVYGGRKKIRQRSVVTAALPCDHSDSSISSVQMLSY